MKILEKYEGGKITHNPFTSTKNYPSLSPGLSKQLLHSPQFPAVLPSFTLVAGQGRDLSKTKHLTGFPLSSVSQLLNKVGSVCVSSTSNSSEPLSYYACAKWNFPKFFKQAARSHTASGLSHKLFTLIGTLCIVLGPVLFVTSVSWSVSDFSSFF